MARLRVAAEDAPDVRLARRGALVWLSGDEISRMTALWVQMDACSSFVEQRPVRHEAYRLSHHAWDFTGPVSELLELWAEERRWAACCAWAKEAPGRSALAFGPFTQRRP
jgi:hypothetical protein